MVMSSPDMAENMLTWVKENSNTNIVEKDVQVLCLSKV